MHYRIRELWIAKYYVPLLFLQKKAGEKKSKDMVE